MKDFVPIAGLYSWFRDGSCVICGRTLRTTGETQGWPSLFMQTARATAEGAGGPALGPPNLGSADISQTMHHPWLSWAFGKLPRKRQLSFFCSPL